MIEIEAFLKYFKGSISSIFIESRVESRLIDF
jgi:hypothetical protein